MNSAFTPEMKANAIVDTISR